MWRRTPKSWWNPVQELWSLTSAGRRPRHTRERTSVQHTTSTALLYLTKLSSDSLVRLQNIFTCSIYIFYGLSSNDSMTSYFLDFVKCCLHYFALLNLCDPCCCEVMRSLQVPMFDLYLTHRVPLVVKGEKWGHRGADRGLTGAAVPTPCRAAASCHFLDG